MRNCWKGCDRSGRGDERILCNVREDAALIGLSVERSEVVDGLAGLMADGLAKAYDLSAREPHCVELSRCRSISHEGWPLKDIVDDQE